MPTPTQPQPSPNPLLVQTNSEFHIRPNNNSVRISCYLTLSMRRNNTRNNLSNHCKPHNNPTSIFLCILLWWCWWWWLFFHICPSITTFLTKKVVVLVLEVVVVVVHSLFAKFYLSTNKTLFAVWNLLSMNHKKYHWYLSAKTKTNVVVMHVLT